MRGKKLLWRSGMEVVIRIDNNRRRLTLAPVEHACFVDINAVQLYVDERGRLPEIEYE